MNHYLKIWPDYFDDVEAGRKTFEVRKADRDFHVGEKMILQEWDPSKESYTGRSVIVDITGKWALPHVPGFVGLQIKKWDYTRLAAPGRSRIYLGARYSRREELVAHKAQLEAAGHIVTSRWLTGEFGDLVGKTNRDEQDPHAAAASDHDTADIDAAEVVVIFTDPPGQGGPNGRGSFHVEFGYGLKAGKRMVLVGSRVNSFHHRPGVHFYTNWAGAWQAEFRPSPEINFTISRHEEQERPRLEDVKNAATFEELQDSFKRMEGSS